MIPSHIKSWNNQSRFVRSIVRGHLPEKPEAAEQSLETFEAWVIAPFFQQGGKYSLDNIHFVQQGDMLVPVSQTRFAQDATFGCKHSNLRKYIHEKRGYGCKFDLTSFLTLTVTLNKIRVGGPEAVAQKRLSLPVNKDTKIIIINTSTKSDMHVVVNALFAASKEGRRYLYRTAAAFGS